MDSAAALQEELINLKMFIIKQVQYYSELEKFANKYDLDGKMYYLGLINGLNIVLGKL